MGRNSLAWAVLQGMLERLLLALTRPSARGAALSEIFLHSGRQKLIHPSIEDWIRLVYPLGSELLSQLPHCLHLGQRDVPHEVFEHWPILLPDRAYSLCGRTRVDGGESLLRDIRAVRLQDIFERRGGIDIGVHATDELPAGRGGVELSKRFYLGRGQAIRVDLGELSDETRLLLDGGLAHLRLDRRPEHVHDAGVLLN